MRQDEIDLAKWQSFVYRAGKLPTSWENSHLRREGCILSESECAAKPAAAPCAERRDDGEDEGVCRAEAGAAAESEEQAEAGEGRCEGE